MEMTVENSDIKHEDNIKMNLSEILFYNVNWIDLAHNKVHCFAVLFMLFVFPVMTVRYTGCPRRNGQNFGRVFLMLKYTDITQNTYIQS